MAAPPPQDKRQEVRPALGIGWFSTGRDQAARELLITVQEAIVRRELSARVTFVFCHREPGEDAESDRFLELVHSYRLPLVTLSSRRFWGRPIPPTPQAREDYDRQVIDRLSGFRPGICLLAGYMLIASPLLCHRFNMINLHPAAPGGPKGTWQEVTYQLIEQRAQATGVMMHLVTPELDQGPPVAYCRFSLRGGAFDPLWAGAAGQTVAHLKSSQGEAHPLFRLIRQEGLRREFPLILATIRLLAQGGVRIEGGRAVDGEGRPIPGYDLTREVEQALTRSDHAG